MDNLETIIENPKNIHDMPLNVASSMKQIKQFTQKKRIKSMNIILHGPRMVLYVGYIPPSVGSLSKHLYSDKFRARKLTQQSSFTNYLFITAHPNQIKESDHNMRRPYQIA